MIASFSLETTKHPKIQSLLLLHFITIRLSDIILGSLVFSQIKGVLNGFYIGFLMTLEST